MINENLIKGRYLFIVEDCEHCLKWKKIIEWINAELPLDKRIRVVDCTELHDFGIVRNPLINFFENILQGAYPVLFIDGLRIDGTNSVIEAEARLRALVHKDFSEPRFNPYMHNRDCYYGERGFLKKRIICN